MPSMTRAKANPRPVPPNDLYPVSSFGAVDVKRAVEKVRAGIAHQCQKAVGTFSKIDRMAGDQHLHARPESCLADRANNPGQMILADIGASPNDHIAPTDLHR